MKRESCRTIAEALASISSLAELEAFSDKLREGGEGVKKPTQSEWSAIAAAKIDFQRI